MKTVLITGCSSGFGLEIANYFLARDWKVIATMRTPREDLFPRSDNLTLLPLDVRDEDSIRAAVAAAGPIDVLVNNAGIGFLNALEGTPIDVTRAIFETNTFGTIRMIQAVLPQLRERKAGTIINITSSATLKSYPLLSAYTASKAAVNALSESLALELEPFNIKVSVVMPGAAPGTSFGQSGMSLIERSGGFPQAYASYAMHTIDAMQQWTEVTSASDVAEVVWRAAADPQSPARLPAGPDAVALFTA